MPETTHTPATRAPEEIQSVEETACCIVGGGPAGAVLSLLLARQGIAVTLLELHNDFDRDFRGDTIHPSVMEVLDQLGLADRLLQLPHGKIRSATVQTPSGPFRPIDLGRLKTRYPYVVMLPQVQFLNFIVGEAKRYPSFKLVMGANVQRLLEEDGVVRGVRYRDTGNHWHEVRALLTVGADGRFSRVRHLAGIKPVETAPPMDVLWFRLPRRPGDVEDAAGGVFGRGRFLVMLNRAEDWQLAYVFPKGGYQQIKQAGLDALRRSIAELAPWLADRVDLLRDWDQVSLLSVASSRVKRWYKPGLLLIGDAAHVMSPVGGVGINYAIQDAVATSNLLSGPLKARRVRPRDLAAVQRRREWPTRVIQAFQGAIQRRVLARALRGDRPLRIPPLVRLLVKLPLLRDLPARLLAFGPRREHVEAGL